MMRQFEREIQTVIERDIHKSLVRLAKRLKPELDKMDLEDREREDIVALAEEAEKE